jgi:serine/threonine-protein kinase RsbW
MEVVTDDAPYGSGPLEIRVAGEPTSLGVLRTVVSAHASAAGFDPDSVADLKLAVDEACTALIVRLDPPGAPLAVVIDRQLDGLAIDISTAGTVVDDPLEGFTGHVLNILADDVKAYQVAAEGISPITGMSMVFRPDSVG